MDKTDIKKAIAFCGKHNLNYIKLPDCEHGAVYKIHSRNLSIGVFNKYSNGFIGIRSKFNDRYLFTEYHWDTGEPFGTVKPLEKLSKIPDGIIISEDLGIDEVKNQYVNNKPLFEAIDALLKEGASKIYDDSDD